MPQPHTHYLVTQQAMKEASPELWERYHNYAGFGSFFPDLFYMTDLPPKMVAKFSKYMPSPLARFILNKFPYTSQKYPNIDYSAVSDTIHWQGSYRFITTSLDYIKKIQDPETRNKLTAWLIGFMGHVIPDALFHPKVYRDTGDHSGIHTTKAYDKHKSLESLLDSYYLIRDGLNQFNFHYADKVRCHSKDSDRTLDEDVFRLISHSLQETYGAILTAPGRDYEQLFGRFEGRETNPILDSYRDYITCIRWMWERPKLARMPKRFNVIVPVNSFGKKELPSLNPLSKTRWLNSTHPDMPVYSYHDIFDMSFKSLKHVINDVMEFLASNENSADVFFSKKPNRPFILTEDMNFDDGLPVWLAKQSLEIDRRHGLPVESYALVDVPTGRFPTLEASIRERSLVGLDFISKMYGSIKKLE